jgi:NAD(P)H-hydrate epimerase
MVQIEKEAEKAADLSTYVLMEKAGQVVADEAAKFLSGKDKVLIICGKGNNGGDGLVAARWLRKQGFSPTIFLLSEKETLTSEAKRALEKLPVDIPILSDIAILRSSLPEFSLVIDAIFGFSLKGAVRGLAAEVIKLLREVEVPILSIDIPSGVEADTGQVYGEVVKASETITFTCPKVGLILYPGANFVGKLIVREIGIPKEIVTKNCRRFLIQADLVQRWLPKRAPDIHKKAVGQVLVIAGSQGMTGAAVLTAKAALRMGAGYVSLVIPASLNEILEGKLTEILTYPMPETLNKTLSEKAFVQISKLVQNYDVVILGPGLSTHSSTVKLVQRLVAKLPNRLVLDADGLNALVEVTDILSERRSETIITPHPGELARLLGKESGEIQSDRVGVCEEVAKTWQLCVLLKGARTVVSTLDESCLNPTGNPGMATAGTGDVLAGMIGALWAQGLSSFKAAAVAAYLHGLAGDLAIKEFTEYSLIASDLIAYLPKALKVVGVGR